AENVKVTIKQRISEICLTEYVDYDYPDPTIDFSLDTTSYHEKIKEMQAKYTGLIQVKKGVEIGVEPHLLSRYEKLIQKKRLISSFVLSILQIDKICMAAHCSKTEV